VDLILVTHGHSDHNNDVVPIAQKFHAQVVAMVETADWISSQGVENVIGFNIGGSVNVHGITQRNTYCWVVRFVDGMITEVRAYVDSFLVKQVIDENER
jgi:L-ascorbate metabolism protein UlaG (beta-lactamase superfamily)